MNWDSFRLVMAWLMPVVILAIVWGYRLHIRRKLAELERDEDE